MRNLTGASDHSHARGIWKKLWSFDHHLALSWMLQWNANRDLHLTNLLAVPAPRLLSLLLSPQPSPPWKSQIAHLVMHQLVFGIDFQIHSVSRTILVSIHLLIHFSTHLCHHPHSSSITPSLQAQNLPFQQILSTVDFFYLLDCLTITVLDRTYHAHHFVSSFTL